MALTRRGLPPSLSRVNCFPWSGAVSRSAGSQRTEAFAIGRRMWQPQNGNEPVSKLPIWPCTVREYMTLLEQAPPLQAQSLTDDYRLLADFNGAVLAAHPTRLGVQFVTWDWSFDHTGLNQGNYFQENYVGAKQDFAIRAGLISKQQIFNQEQLVEIYRCCSDTLDAGFDLTAEQEKCIRGVQEQIATAAPDALERIREQEQHPMEPYNQEPIM